MKNATRLLALFFVAATTFFASCSDDTDTPSSLSGTTWVAQNQITDTADDGTLSVETVVWQLTFVDRTSGMLDTKTQRDSEQPREYRFPFSYSYSLSGSTGSGSIVIEDIFGSGENLSVSFTVNGDKLTISNTDNGDIVFTRQSSSSPTPAATGLEGTTWQTTFSQPYLDDDDNEHDGNITITIAFANSYSGTMRAEYIVPDIPSAGYNDGGTFSYTYTAPNGTINLPFAEAELSFTIDGDDLSLVMGPNRVYTLHKI